MTPVERIWWWWFHLVPIPLWNPWLAWLALIAIVIVAFIIAKRLLQP